MNGGGTGALEDDRRRPSETEVAAGSGFFKSHLFDAYKSPFVRSLAPAVFFALEVVRRPGPGFVTCSGGGVIASGAGGADRSPIPWHPPNLALTTREMAGEVQTPLHVPPGTELALGDAVLFASPRPAS